MSGRSVVPLIAVSVAAAAIAGAAVGQPTSRHRFCARPSGKRLSFSYGGSLRYGSFVVCRTRPHARVVVAVQWGLVDSAHSSVDETIYTFNGLHFRLIGRKTYRVAGGRVPPRIP